MSRALCFSRHILLRLTRRAHSDSRSGADPRWSRFSGFNFITKETNAMPYKFLEDTSMADVAFEAQGKTLDELFKEAALAVTNTMVEDVRTIEQKTSKSIELTAANVEMLLFHFLQELIFYKDAELLLFNKFDIALEKKEQAWHLHGKAYGEKISPDRHELLADVKAVSLYKYRVEKAAQGWRATGIVDFLTN